MHPWSRRRLLGVSAGAVTLILTNRQVAWSQDTPGQEATDGARIPAALQSLLPPFTATLFDPPPAGQGWGPVMLSPSGKAMLAQRREGGHVAVFLLDRNGEPVKDLTSEHYPLAEGVWGPDDTQILLECRREENGRAEFMKVFPASGRLLPASVAGLPTWAAGGKAYFLETGRTDSPSGGHTAAGHFQRFTASNMAVGTPLLVTQPVWSGDGQWLAFLRERPRPAEADDKRFSPVREVRVIPARGTVQRVVLPFAAWDRLIKERGWRWASGPERLFWGPSGEALYGFCTARTDSEETRYLMRIDLKEPKRDVVAVDDLTDLVSASADGRHWLLQLGDRHYRLDLADR